MSDENNTKGSNRSFGDFVKQTTSHFALRLGCAVLGVTTAVGIVCVGWGLLGISSPMGSLVLIGAAAVIGFTVEDVVKKIGDEIIIDGVTKQQEDASQNSLSNSPQRENSLNNMPQSVEDGFNAESERVPQGASSVQKSSLVPPPLPLRK